MENIKKSGMVTGAAQGIGKAIDLRLMKDGYGLSLPDILETELAQTDQEIRSAFGDRVQSKRIDMTKPDQVNGAVKAHVERFAGINLLVSGIGRCRLYHRGSAGYQRRDADDIKKWLNAQGNRSGKTSRVRVEYF